MTRTHSTRRADGKKRMSLAEKARQMRAERQAGSTHASRAMAFARANSDAANRNARRDAVVEDAE